MRKFMGLGKKKTGAADPGSADADDADTEFPEPDGCLMIFSDPEARGSKRSA